VKSGIKKERGWRIVKKKKSQLIHLPNLGEIVFFLYWLSCDSLNERNASQRTFNNESMSLPRSPRNTWGQEIRLLYYVEKWHRPFSYDHFYTKYVFVTKKMTLQFKNKRNDKNHIVICGAFYFTFLNALEYSVLEIENFFLTLLLSIIKYQLTPFLFHLLYERQVRFDLSLNGFVCIIEKMYKVLDIPNKELFLK
jgi:hypothetical protein